MIISTSIDIPLQCDESPISCSACVKRGTRCSFRPPSPLQSPTLSCIIPGQVGGTLDLELLHNFSTKTCVSITDHASLQQFYRTDFISEALKSGFLLRCLLALSAFHLADQNRELLDAVDEEQKPAILSKTKGYLAAAHGHYNAGLSSFRDKLQNITSENCHALFGCSCLIAMTSFAQSCDGVRSVTERIYSLDANQESGFSIIKWILLVRGVKTVRDAAQDWIHSGPMSPIRENSGNEGYKQDAGQVDEDITLYLDKLSTAIRHHSDPDGADTCIAAITLLRKSFAGVACGCDFSVVFMWPVHVKAHFIDMLESNRSEALVVLASFCVLLHTQNWRWWIKGWSSNMFNAIEGNVDKLWKPWLAWPLQVIEDGDARQAKNSIPVVTEGICCQ